MISRPNARPTSSSRRRRLGALLGLAALQCMPATPPSNAGASAPPAGAAPAAAAPAPPAPAPAGPAAAAGSPASDPSTPAGATPPEEPKFDFDALLARERPASPLKPVVDPKGRWRSTIESRRAPLVVDKGDHVSVRTTLATKDEVRCEVHPGQLNPGATVANLLGAAGGSVALENAVVYRVGVAKGAPVLFVRAGYMTRESPPRGGELKVAISPGSDSSILCIHDEPGFRESFVRAVEGFVSAFEPSTPPRPPQYSALWQYQVGDAKTGYSWERIFADADGSISSYTCDVTLAQLASGEIRVRDDLAAEIHDRRGILRANYLSYRGITKAQEIQIERSDAGPYAYRGVVDGKAIEGKLAPKAALGSLYELLLQLQRAKSGQPFTFRQDEYRPRQDPLHAQNAEYAFDPTSGALERKGGATSEVQTLSDGLPSSTRLTVGRNTFVGSLIERHNSFGSQRGVTVGTRPAPDAAAPLPLAERRRSFETHVTAETDHTPAKTPPAGVLNKVTYPAPLGANVAYVSPPRKGAKRPGVIWLGGGLDWSIGEWAWAKAARNSDRSARAFRDAGLALMLPALRGSNENPGKNECLFGEVEDVLAAASYLAAREDVDPERIYLAGHATGGTLALLTAASSDRFRAVFAFGPVGDTRQYGTPSGGGCLPDTASADEVALRAPLGFMSTIHTPTYVFEGGVGGNADVFEDLRESASSRVHFTVVPGVDPTGIVAPGTEAIARAIASGHVDDDHLIVEPTASAAKK
jgi:pimeloyl-ACP methyl ester carboxylesterase